MSSAVAPDDIVDTHEQAAGNARAPLLVLEPLRAFLDEHGLGAGALRASPIGEGHSNVTYLVCREDGSELVVRRPPRPPLPPSAHDVLREARLLRALEHTPARVPRVLAVGDDPAVMGCPFYVMERVEGEAIVFTLPSALDTPAERRRIAQELIDALVEVHAVDWRAAGLEDFGRPTGYLERQLRRFGGLWELNKTREIPAVERVARWLSEHLPESGPATIVHGDYRLGNTMYALDAPARLTAVLDWEMATIGDPLADLGYMCMVWGRADDPPTSGDARFARIPEVASIRDSLGAVTKAEGFPTRAELVERYEAQTGRSMSDLRWYVTLAVWKMTVFMEGNYRRALAGATDDPYLKHFGEGVLALAAHAEEATRGG